jgi:hypothetical protein
VRSASQELPAGCGHAAGGVTVSLFGKLLGRSGEDRAAKHLAARGYTILERNYTAPQGELRTVIS